MKLRNLLVMTLLCGLCHIPMLRAESEQRDRHPVTDVHPNWRLGVQCWSFKKFTFFETVDKVSELGLNWLEAYPGQALFNDIPGAKLYHTMSEENRRLTLDKLRACGVRLVNYGVVGLPNDEAECRKVFDFAKAMGIETIVSEPPADAFDMVERLCREYKIKVAIHNHPEPTQYWDPQRVLDVVKDRSSWLGACADTGHWTRSGIKPVDALRKLQGRVLNFHLKDLNEFGNKAAHDVVWGTGVSDIDGILAEMNRQDYHGAFSVEYEYNWDNSLPEIAASVAYFQKKAAQYGQSGWHDLFAPDLSNADYKAGSWTLENGVLTRKGGDDIWTKQQYGDFILDLQFKVAEQTNSGVFIRAGEKTWLPWVEVQILDSHGQQPDRYACGGIFDIQAPNKDMVHPAGQWNHLTIWAEGSRITVVMNGQQIVDMDLNEWAEAGKNPDGSENKFKSVAYKDLPRKGFLGFQDHGHDVWFRHIRVKEL